MYLFIYLFIHRENLQARFFYTWHTRHEQSVETRMNTRMAILHCDATCLKNTWVKWRQKTQQKLEEHFNMVRVILLHTVS